MSFSLQYTTTITTTTHTTLVTTISTAADWQMLCVFIRFDGHNVKYNRCATYN